MENLITVSFNDVKDKTVKIKHLDIDDLFDDENDEPLKFDKEHFSTLDKLIRFLECKNCRLGSDVYLFVYNNKKKLFAVQESIVMVGNKKIMINGWDTMVKLSLTKGNVKLKETR
jgi:hypothetical protein